MKTRDLSWVDVTTALATGACILAAALSGCHHNMKEDPEPLVSVCAQDPTKPMCRHLQEAR